MTDVIAFLRQSAGGAYSVAHSKHLAHAAADLLETHAATISHLTEEVERLRLERDEAVDAKRREHVLHVENVASVTARVKAAEQEVERLRAALAEEEARADEAEADATLWHEAANEAVARHTARAEQAEARVKELEGALRGIAEGNLGDAPWQASYERIRDIARATLSHKEG